MTRRKPYRPVIFKALIFAGRDRRRPLVLRLRMQKEGDGSSGSEDICPLYYALGKRVNR